MAEQRQQKRNRPAPGLRARALGLLARREHSRLELERKLAPHAQDAHELEDLLDDFTRRGWLSERRVVEQIVHARRGKLGSQRIRRELLDKGIAAALVAEVLPRLKEGDIEAARAVWRKKFGKSPRNMAERARQVRFMLGRGFALDTVLRVIEQGGGDE